LRCGHLKHGRVARPSEVRKRLLVRVNEHKIFRRGKLQFLAEAAQPPNRRSIHRQARLAEGKLKITITITKILKLPFIINTFIKIHDSHLSIKTEIERPRL
jgi:hypothetical protein